MRRAASRILSAGILTAILALLGVQIAVAQVPPTLHKLTIVDDQLTSVELTVGYEDENELDGAVPGNSFDLLAYLVSTHPITTNLIHVGNDDSANQGQVFQATFSAVAKSKPTPDKHFYCSVYRLAVKVVQGVEPHPYGLQLVFDGEVTASVSVPVGMNPPKSMADPNFLALRPPDHVEVNCFGEPSNMKFSLDNKFGEYNVKVLGYTVENSQHLIVGGKRAADPGSDLLTVRHGGVGELDVLMSADAWHALWVPDSNPQMTITLAYTDGWRHQIQTFPTSVGLPFRLTYHPLVTLAICLIGACIGATFRAQMPGRARKNAAERRWNRGRRLYVWSFRVFLALLAAFLGWTLSYGLGVEMTAKDVAIVSAKTPYGALIIGVLMGLIPPSRFGAWIYQRLTGQRFEDMNDCVAEAPEPAGPRQAVHGGID